MNSVDMMQTALAYIGLTHDSWVTTAQQAHLCWLVSNLASGVHSVKISQTQYSLAPPNIKRRCLLRDTATHLPEDSMLWSVWDLRWGSDEHPTLLCIREYQQSTGPISKFSHRLVALSVVMLRGQILEATNMSVSITMCWIFSSSGLWYIQRNNTKQGQDS